MITREDATSFCLLFHFCVDARWGGPAACLLCLRACWDVACHSTMRHAGFCTCWNNIRCSDAPYAWVVLWECCVAPYRNASSAITVPCSPLVINYQNQNLYNIGVDNNVISLPAVRSAADGTNRQILRRPLPQRAQICCRRPDAIRISTADSADRIRCSG